ncbi:hypothetical protein [Bradyrhizobium sp. 26S5]|uniref:hypothetical protein n=1 Tax=Bradyrhizobium sp. 26S5 TaxID=3139729 RepID=UPI0030D31C8B
MLGLSLHGWENAMVVFLIIAGLFALVAGVATWAVVRLQRVELARSETELQEYKLQTSKEIAESAKQTEQAKASAAEAYRKAELERLERLKLEAIVAPRSLGVAQQQTLAAAWRSLAGKRVSVTSYSLDGEGAGLASQIMAALKSAGVGIDNRLATVMPMGSFALGVHVTGSDTQTVSEIRNGLTSTGLAIAPSGTPLGNGPSVSTSPTPVAEAPIADILVGIKPVPTIR